MSKLIILALLCAVAYVQAQAGTISSVVYKFPNCTEALGNTTYLTGDCKFNTISSTSSAWYFDATNVYTVSFYGLNCSSSMVQAIQQIPIGCATRSYASAWVTSGTSAAAPFTSFPPSGYATGSSFYNVTAADAKATACSAGNGIVEIKSAANFGYCNPRSASTFRTTPSATKGFCNADGTAAGSVVFSDETCTAAAAGSSTPIASTCTTSGSSASNGFSCGSTPTFPSEIPTQGFVTYSNAACTTPSNPTTSYIGATCFDSQTLVCGTVNGTDGYATWTQYTSLASGAKDGSCGGASSNSQSVLAGTCVPYPAGSTTSFRKYFCQGTGPSGGSASIVSVSVVATLFAAIATVFAARSL